jgi:succinate-semialdehyde dehydrogenase / glutarate-semialdehyde dehydrogenase
LQTRNLIGGQWVGARSGNQFEVRNPADNSLLGLVPNSGTEETREAVAAAQAAFPGWRSLPALERSRLLRRVFDQMIQRQEELAQLLTKEQGKPLAEARGEIAYAASFMEWAAEEAKRVYGETIPASSANKRIIVIRQPVGVTACITPWNFPAAMITRKLGPALAAGCTMVVKPAEQTPLSALALGEICQDVGIPAGVVNIVTGDPAAIGDELMTNEHVRKVSFTGSTEIGKLLMTKAAHHVTRLSLELGGHAPFLVFADADLDAAVQGTMVSKFRNMGQTCICPNRFLVHESVEEAFVTKLQQAMEKLRLGDGMQEGVHVGPLIDDAAVEKVKLHVSNAQEQGAQLRCGGKAVQPQPHLTARYFTPTLMCGITPSMKIWEEETFGPVAAVTRFSSEQEAIELANLTPFGLAAYFYTRDVHRAFRVAERLDYGIIGINDGAPSTAQAPFGGMKQSGFGREGGHFVMNEYLEVKYLSWGIQDHE